MNASLDFAVAGSAFASFTIFLVIHSIGLRRTAVEKTSQVILQSIGVCFALDILIFTAWTFYAELSLSTLPAIFAGGLSVALFIFLVFHYICWVFGMGEAAVRIRLLRLIQESPNSSLSLKEILEKYNAEKMLRTRLERLTGSGHLMEENGIYRIRSRAILLQSLITRTLKKILGVKD